jgi:hypothetical protein
MASRIRFLAALYEKTGGSQLPLVNMYELGNELALGREVAEEIGHYLSCERLVDLDIGGGMRLTHEGIVHVERASAESDRGTASPSVVNNIVNVRTMTGSSIQQSGSHSSLTATLDASEVIELRQFLGQLQHHLAELERQTNRADDLAGHFATVMAHLRTSKPNRHIVVEAVKTIRTVLEGMAGNVLASGLLSQIPKWLGS